MADLVAGTAGWEVGTLSKQADEWVLATQAFEGDALKGFMLTTLERIGGTPAMVIGLGAVDRSRQRAGVLKAMMAESYHKVLMAFPDEDVLVATRLTGVGPLEALTDLSDIRPWPETRANGEERAWGRRLSKRYGAADFNDRTMVARSDGDTLAFDHESLKQLDGEEILDDCTADDGEYVIAWGWAMAEFLEGFHSPAT
ncbi:MAG: hypothetical protein AAF467_10965 [Actinomycetota bacterium]